MLLMLADPTVSSDLYKMFMSSGVTLIGAGVAYIARQAHTISQQVGKVHRTLFGEDGESGIHVAVAQHGQKLTEVDRRLERIETTLDLKERRHP